MATSTVAPGGVGAKREGVNAWQVARWLTLVLYAVTLLGVAVGGARTASVEDLQAALQQGAVDQVRVVGALDGPGGYSDAVQGVSTVRLEWQDGWHRSVAEIWQVSSLEELRSQGFDETSRDYIIGDVGQELRRIAPGVEIVSAEWPNGIYGSFGGWEVRGAYAYLPMALLVACLIVLVNSPQPRLATRWGWAWLMLSPTILVAAPAYLILGARGQLPGRRRLNGIVAFLIVGLLL
ncbi:hypothetical protein [Ornithinimicrobium cryptoxanthini]|uniref:Uncharacterized protein n=1 Tax=Ornithinimicrobium cryptoxanthini TaxID=2934161 RepID=A0ABY4YNA7_9MICO|nr:hypothetical protein [Ornithinimicrobium cryptoxanthini]USQ77637.1 hypothetical protein NF557_06965 [Ornithinimicrobium cryptoxanthini]